MVIGVFGENCVGKSTIAEKFKGRIGAEVYVGKDYLRFSKNESNAKSMFCEMLCNSKPNENIIYVISDEEQLSLLPENALSVLVTCELDLIKERFAKRFKGNLPKPVEDMLERNHGRFDNERCDFHIVSSGIEVEREITQIVEHIKSV